LLDVRFSLSWKCFNSPKISDSERSNNMQ
jgi:hypothetical protein